jgi:hypothetical protein
MDPQRFDTLVRTLGTSSRRHAIRLLVGGALGGLLARLGPEGASATHGCRHTGAGCSKPSQCCSGRCAGNDTCQPCSRASQCPAPPASEPCKQRVCTSTGRCVIKKKPNSTGCGGERVCCGGVCRLPLHHACSGNNAECCPKFVCQDTVVNGNRQLFCCRQDGLSCTADAVCCTTNCDADSGTCTTCQGRPCGASDPPCCTRWACEDGFCGGCANAGRPCTATTRPCCAGSGDCIDGWCGGCIRRENLTSVPGCSSGGVPCCDTDCTSGVCLSALGGDCAVDEDCEACSNDPNQCDGACDNGTCTV